MTKLLWTRIQLIPNLPKPLIDLVEISLGAKKLILFLLIDLEIFWLILSKSVASGQSYENIFSEIKHYDSLLQVIWFGLTNKSTFVDSGVTTLLWFFY